MIIKKAVYKKQKVVKSVMVSNEVYGCDECRTAINQFPNEDSRLELTVFRTNDEKTEHKHFCSWKCVLKHLPKIKTDYFISFPFLYFDDIKNPISKRNGKAFIDIIKKLKL